MIPVLLLIVLLSVLCNSAVYWMLTTDPTGNYIAARTVRAWANLIDPDLIETPLEILT